MNIPENLIKLRSGTSLQGYVTVGYKQLIELFGEPYTDPCSYKTDVEWIILTPHGPTTIYNYKNGYSYLGKFALKVEEMDEWHVGGKNEQSYGWIVQRITTG